MPVNVTLFPVGITDLVQGDPYRKKNNALIFVLYFFLIDDFNTLPSSSFRTTSLTNRRLAQGPNLFDQAVDFSFAMTLDLFDIPF